MGDSRPRPRVGISSCLLGEPVRYDGGHKHASHLTETLGPLVQWVAVCPEVEAGLGTPREKLHLEGAASAPRLVFTSTAIDITERMLGYAAERLRKLEKLGLHGYVLKSKSPSCGPGGVPVQDPRGHPARPGRGIFAALLMERFPLLPVEQENLLEDPRMLDGFIERLQGYFRWSEFLEGQPRTAHLGQFHAGTTSLLRSRRPEHEERLAKIARAASSEGDPRLLDEYGTAFMAALREPRR